MAAVTAKYIVRGRVGNSQRLLSTLENTLAEVALLAGQALFSAAMPTFPGSVSPLEQLRRMCGAVEVLSQQVAAMDERGIEFPRPQIEAILKISIPGSPAE